MVQSLWYTLGIVLAAAIAVAAVVALILRWAARQEEEQETYQYYATPDFRAEAGFAVTGYPNDEIYIPREYWLVDRTIGELRYTIVPGNSAALRVAPSGRLKIPREYREESYESVAQYPIDEITVTQSQSPGRRAMTTWSKEGFDYALLSPQPEMNMQSGAAYRFVKDTFAVKAS